MFRVSYIVNSVFPSRTYVLSRDGSTGLTTGDSNDVWLVDCGDVERFPEVRVVTNGFGVMALREPRLNISAYHSEFEDFVLTGSARVEVVQEGDAFDVLGEVVRVFETPGHDPSCLCFEVDGRLFTGDAFIPGVKVFTGFPKGDKKLAAASVERILGLSEGVVVCAGHEV